MKDLLVQLGTRIKTLSDEWFDSAFRNHEPIPDIYEVQINDHVNRVAKTLRFENVREAMAWAESKDLLYEPNKSVYLIRVKSTGVNDILRLNICNHVSTQRPAVYSGKRKNKAVLV